MIWFSPASETVAVSQQDRLAVQGPAVQAELTGAYAEEFLRVFLAAEPSAAGRLDELGALGSRDHRALAAVARQGGGRPWVPLTAYGSGSVLFLEVVGRCNERCVHCYADSAPEVTAALDRETCLRVVGEGAALGFERLQLTGGDPLLCAFLPDLAAAGREAGFRRIEVYTNGLALGPERMDSLARHDVSFAFSFYSYDAATHDAITRVPGSQVRTRTAIEAAVQRGLEVRAAIVGVEANLGHVEETRALLLSLGVPASAISFDRVRHVGRGRGHDAIVPAESGGGHAQASAEGAGPSWPGKLCVSYTGQVYPCIFARSRALGDVGHESLGAIVLRARAVMSGSSPSPGRGLHLLAMSDRLACLDCRLTTLALEGRAR